MRIITEAARWLFIACGVSVYLAGLYLMFIDLRSNQHPPHGILDWAVRVASGVLVMGLLPLIVAVVWALRAHTPRYFGQGALVLLGMLAFHYFLFAVAAHSFERSYPWVQAVEFILFGLALRFLLKSAPALT